MRVAQRGSLGWKRAAGMDHMVHLFLAELGEPGARGVKAGGRKNLAQPGTDNLGERKSFS